MKENIKPKSKLKNVIIAFIVIFISTLAVVYFLTNNTKKTKQISNQIDLNQTTEVKDTTSAEIIQKSNQHINRLNQKLTEIDNHQEQIINNQRIEKDRKAAPALPDINDLLSPNLNIDKKSATKKEVDKNQTDNNDTFQNQDFKLEKFQLRGTANDVLLIDFSFKNTTSKPVKILNIECTTFDQDTILGTVHDTIPVNLQPNSTKTFKNYLVSKVDPATNSVECKVINKEDSTTDVTKTSVKIKNDTKEKIKTSPEDLEDITKLL